MANQQPRTSPHTASSPCKPRHQPGHTYCAECWPPRGRGRGESLSSLRRINAKLRALEVVKLRQDGATYAAIARRLGYRDRSSAWRAERRLWALWALWRPL